MPSAYNGVMEQPAMSVRPPEPGMSQHCAILAVDVAGFTDPKRDDEVQLAVRDALYRLLIAAFDSVGIGWDGCSHEDRGDGALVIVPLHMPTAVLADPLLDHVRAGLRRHNRLSSDAVRIRLRVAVHIGEVHHDRYGFVGTAVNHLFRLLNAPVLKDVLASSSGELALIVSDYVYDSVIRHGPGLIDPATYTPVIAVIEDAPVHAWIHTPAERPQIPRRQRLVALSSGSSREAWTGRRTTPDDPFRPAP
jgi:hypothetical protein